MTAETQHYQALAEEWRSDTLAVLGSNAVRQALGPEVAMRLSMHAAQAGVLAVRKHVGQPSLVDEGHSSKAENGVYLTPISRRTGGSKIRIPFEEPGHEWTLPDFNDVCYHLLLQAMPSTHLVTMPTRNFTRYARERAALLIHELTHIDQAKRAPSWSGLFVRDVVQAVASECQAYNAQFKALDACVGGGLEEVCKATLSAGDILSRHKTMVVPQGLSLPGKRRNSRDLTRTEALTVLHEAYNRIGGYRPDDSWRPPELLMNIYLREDPVLGSSA